jgi:GNAT superfamily N-acetyltransferase
MTATYRIRMATMADIPTIVHHRRAMFSEMGWDDPSQLDAMAEESHLWLARKIPSGEYLTWFAIAPDESIAAGAGMWLIDWPPTTMNVNGPAAMILNVYAEHAHRRRGLAKRLVTTQLDWCRAQGIRVAILHASEAGRALYAALGFQPTNEMRLRLDTE